MRNRGDKQTDADIYGEKETIWKKERENENRGNRQTDKQTVQNNALKASFIEVNPYIQRKRDRARGDKQTNNNRSREGNNMKKRERERKQRKQTDRQNKTFL